MVAQGFVVPTMNRSWKTTPIIYFHILISGKIYWPGCNLTTWETDKLLPGSAAVCLSSRYSLALTVPTSDCLYGKSGLQSGHVKVYYPIADVFCPPSEGLRQGPHKNTHSLLLTHTFYINTACSEHLAHVSNEVYTITDIRGTQTGRSAAEEVSAQEIKALLA